jgi:hypothetical protein
MCLVTLRRIVQAELPVLQQVAVVETPVEEAPKAEATEENTAE